MSSSLPTGECRRGDAASAAPRCLPRISLHAATSCHLSVHCHYVAYPPPCAHVYIHTLLHVRLCALWHKHPSAIHPTLSCSCSSHNLPPCYVSLRCSCHVAPSTWKPSFPAPHPLHTHNSPPLQAAAAHPSTTLPRPHNTPMATPTPLPPLPHPATRTPLPSALPPNKGRQTCTTTAP